MRKVKNKLPEELYDLALLEWKAKSYPAAETAIQACLAKGAQIRHHIRKKKLKEQARILYIEILFSQKKNSETIKSLLTRWIEAHSGENRSHSPLIHLLFSLCNRGMSHQNAISILKNITDKHRNNRKKYYAIFLALADLYYTNNEKKNAFDTYTQVLSITSNKHFKTSLQLRTISILLDQNNKTEAKKRLNQIVTSKDIDTRFYHRIASLLEKTDNVDQALSFAQKARTAYPASPLILDTLGTIFFRLERYNQATTLFEQALRLAPNDQIIKQNLAHAHRRNK